MDLPPCTRKSLSCAFQIGTLAAARAGGAGGGSRRSTPPRGEDREVGRVFEGPARDPKPRKGAEKKRQEWTQHVNNPT